MTDNNDLIRRSDALNGLSRWAIEADRPRTWMNAMDKAKEIVRSTPAVDAVEVVHAYYIPCKLGYGYKCSNCKAREKTGALISGTHKFCYACGARMDGRREEEHNAAD